jgi:hypothetical protein
MPAKHTIVAVAVTVVLPLTSSMCAQTKAPAPKGGGSIRHQAANTGADSSDAVRDFVQKFYNQYLDTTFSATAPSLHVDEFVEADLMRALREDAASFDTRETLSFDPFLDSNDACPRYDVVDVRRDGQTYKVTVHPVCADPRWQTQRPIVDVRAENDRWKISNMTYDHDGLGDLKSLLCKWAKADIKPERRPDKC